MNALKPSFGRAFSSSQDALRSDLHLGYFNMALIDMDRVAVEFGLREPVQMEDPSTTGPRSSLQSGRGSSTQAAGTDPVLLLAPDQTLSAGQVAIVQFNTDDADDPNIGGVQNMARDSLSFVLLDGVTSGTVIHFTDRTWTASGVVLNSGAFSNSGADGTYTWTASIDHAAGTVITISEAELTAAGMELIDTGEAIYYYQGTADTPIRFLGAIEVADGNNTFNASLVNTGLTVGVNALAIAEDNGSFGERTWNHQISTLLSNIVDRNNWHTNENSPQTNHVEGTNLFVAPDHMLWMAGISGGHALMTVAQDSTQNGGATYNQQFYLQNTSADGDGNTNTQRFWSPTHILFDTVGNKFFVVDSSGSIDRILQGNISDLLTNPGVAPTMTILWEDTPDNTSDGDGITGMQIDKINGHIYFTADNTLLRVNYNTADQTAVVLADLGNDVDTGQKNFANELVLDLANGRALIVSTESFSDFIESPPGSGNFVVATTLVQNSFHVVANISPSDANATGNTITEVTFSGIYDETSNPFLGGADPQNFEDSFGRITDVDLNTLTGEFWFTTVQLNGGANGETGGIFKMTIDGAGNATVTQMASEGASNRNYQHIHIDEETGNYYVSSLEPGEGGQHAIYRGGLSDAPGTLPTLYADVGNINDIVPRDMTLESAPTLTGNALAAAVTEATSAPNSGETARTFLFSGLVAGDIDTPNTGDELAGAQVRISDNFLRETSTNVGHTLSQDSLTINATQSGTIAGSGIAYSYNATTGVMTLTGAATVTEYTAALQLVAFSTTGDNPTDDGSKLTRTISASVFYGLLYSDELNTTVTVTGINDAPLNVVGATVNAIEDTPIAITSLVVADADTHPTSQDIQVTLNVTHGTLAVFTNVGGGVELADVSGNGTDTVTITATQAQINITFAAANGVTFTPTAQYNGAAVLTIVTNDLGNNGNDPGLTGTGTSEEDNDQLAIMIAAVNDEPAGTDFTIALNEDGATGFDSSSFGFSDVDGNAMAGVVLTTLPNSGDLYLDGIAITVAGTLVSAIDLDAGKLTYRPDPNGSGLGYASFTFQVRDNGGTANNGVDTDQSPNTVTFDVNAINDAPVQIVPGAQSLNEGSSITFDAGNSNLISIGDIDAAGSDLTTTLSAVDGSFTVGSIMAGLVVTGSGTNSLTLVGSAAEINDALDGLNYAPPTNVSGSRTITITTDDGGATGGDPGLSGTGSSEADSDEIVLNIAAVNDEPAGTDFQIALNEDGATGFDSSSFGFSDVDGNAMAGVVLTTLPGSGDLYLDGIAITVAGTFVSAIDLDAGKLTYRPDPNGNGSGYATFTFQVRDDGGTANNGVDTDQSPNTVTLDVNAINDAPVNNVPGIQTFNEDGSLTFSAGNGNAITVSDVDVGAGNLSVTLSIQTGGLTLSTVTGLTFTTGDGTADTNMTFSGTAAAINTALNGLVYTPGANYNGDRTLTITTNDLGNTGGDPGATGDGSSEQDSDTIAVDVTSVNDAPVVIGDGTEEATPIVEDTPTGGQTVSSLFSGQYSDAADAQFSLSNPGGSSSGSFSGIAVVANGSSGATGQWQYFNSNTSTWVDIGSRSTASALLIGSGTNIRFNPAPDFNGAAPTLNVHLIDNSLGFGITFGQVVNISAPAATGGTTAYSTGTVLLSQNVVPDGIIDGTAGNDVLTGTPQSDIFDLTHGGEDQASGLGGNDGFYMGNALSAGDQLDGGDGVNDQLILQGNVTATIIAAHLQNIEVISLLSGDVTRFGDTANNLYDYSLTMTDAAVDAGERLKVWFAGLRAGEDVFFNGSAETDGHFTFFGGFGSEHLIGGHGNDFFFFGDGRFSVTDRVVGNGGAQDQLGLRGSYNLVFEDDTMTGIDTITLISGSDPFYGLPTAGFGYNVTTHDLNVAAGETLAVWGLNLTSTEQMIFNGSNETNGSFRLFGGAGNDVLTGGAGNDMIYGGLRGDTLTGGAGNDTFVYRSVGDSNSTERDGIQDFLAGDLIDLSFIDADSGTAGDQAFNFIGSSAFTGGEGGGAGQLRFENISLGGPIWLVQGDTDGDGVSDIEIVLVIPSPDPITAADFIL